MRPASTLICTVGTSLFAPNLKGLAADDPDPVRSRLAAGYAAQNWDAVASALASLDPNDRLCGAEINSLASLFARGYAEPRANLFLCHSATPDGRAIGRTIERYYANAGYPVVQPCEIAGLQDQDPRQFRTRGLRNLAKAVCKVIRDYGPAQCAINATGGYKAQIAIAVMMGQALGVPVYYKHERFDEIIAFPPMPVALDFQAWMQLSGTLGVLDRQGTVPAEMLDDDPEHAEVLESLVERVEIDGRDYLDLSPAGQIFHETFRERFRTRRDEVLPPPVPAGQKQAPKLGHHVVINKNWDEVERFLRAVTVQVPQVRRCVADYCNPDLPQAVRFRLDGGRIRGLFSDGTYTVGFLVETTARADIQRAAVVAALNEWLDSRR